MTRMKVRTVATALGLVFGAYFIARSLWWTSMPSSPLLAVSGTVLFLVVIVAAVFLEGRAEGGLPNWSVALVLLSAAAIPAMVTFSLRVDDREAPFATWYLGGLGLLGMICIVRRRFWWGWLVLLVLAASSTIYLGPVRAFELGLVGSASWTVLTQLLVVSWDRAVRDTEHLAGIQQAASSMRATQRVRQRERRVRVQYALTSAGPILTRTVETGGMLTDEERFQARLAEGRLRDELRGAALLNADVREAIESARREGTLVTVFDEGGLDGIDEKRREEIRDELALVLNRARTRRVIVRAARDERIAVTVVGRAGGSRLSEEDPVDLWHEIPRAAEEGEGRGPV